MTTGVYPTRQSLIEALHRAHDQGKAEIVNGEIVILSPTGGKPSRVSGLIFAALLAYERQSGRGTALPNNAGYLVDLPHRGSFSPDASFVVGKVLDADFIDGAPIFAVEVRSKHDYGPPAERALRAKIADYFAAGTLVVWDVDALRDHVIRVYRAAAPDTPTVYAPGESAEAEPALPGWRVPVDDLLA